MVGSMATNQHAEQVRPIIPVGPSEERWRAMTATEREAFLIEVLDVLSDPRIAMTEGRPHKRAKSRAIDVLGQHFRAMGKRVYLAEDMAVVYPGEPSFSPDVFAVLDVDEPEEDERMAWVVVDEGKGPDWVLEVLWAGDRKKDLVDNVERYAALGIPEYFVYDRARQRLHGYRLTSGKRYQPILPQLGLYRSDVLGLDFAIAGGRLRFYQGTAELYDTTHLMRRLQDIMENVEARATAVEARATAVEARSAEAEARLAASEARSAASEARSAEAETRSAASDARAERALGTVRRAIRATLSSRGVHLSDEGLARLEACGDSDVLDRWFERALIANVEADLW